MYFLYVFILFRYVCVSNAALFSLTHTREVCTAHTLFSFLSYYDRKVVDVAAALADDDGGRLAVMAVVVVVALDGFGGGHGRRVSRAGPPGIVITKTY